MKEVATVPMAQIQKEFSLAKIKIGFAKLQNEAKELIFSEDNLEHIKSFLGKCKEGRNLIDAIHKKGKEEAWNVCQQWDAAKRQIIAEYDYIDSIPQEKYKELCLQIRERDEAIERENKRRKEILEGIEKNVVRFALQIAESATVDELIRIERVINLEKGKKAKYAEFAQEVHDKFTALNSNLAERKKVIKAIEELQQQKKEAEQSGDHEKQIEIVEKEEILNSEIVENSILVQETAINGQLENNFTYVPSSKVIRAKRTTWKFEIESVAMLLNKAPELAAITLNDNEVKKRLADLKSSGVLNGKREFSENGIRYFMEEKF